MNTGDPAADSVYQAAATAMTASFRPGSRAAADAVAYASTTWFRAAVDAAVAWAISEGRRQATEGWERGCRWGVVLGAADEPQYKCGSEEDARSFAATRPGSRVVSQASSRLVGPWEPAEQPNGKRPAPVAPDLNDPRG